MMKGNASVYANIYEEGRKRLISHSAMKLVPMYGPERRIHVSI